jgi:hypothetical protein
MLVSPKITTENRFLYLMKDCNLRELEDQFGTPFMDGIAIERNSLTIEKAVSLYWSRLSCTVRW